jgi:hypothetical protein
MSPRRELRSGSHGFSTQGYVQGGSYQHRPADQKARDDSPATGYPTSARWRPDDQRPGADLGGPSTLPEGDCYPASDRSDGLPACDWSGGKPLHDLSD